MYQCDFLALTSDIVATKFDAVWDVQVAHSEKAVVSKQLQLDLQALVSINPRDRKQYVRTVRSLLADQFRFNWQYCGFTLLTLQLPGTFL